MPRGQAPSAPGRPPGSIVYDEADIPPGLRSARVSRPDDSSAQTRRRPAEDDGETGDPPSRPSRSGRGDRRTTEGGMQDSSRSGRPSRGGRYPVEDDGGGSDASDGSADNHDFPPRSARRKSAKHATSSGRHRPSMSRSSDGGDGGHISRERHGRSGRSSRRKPAHPRLHAFVFSADAKPKLKPRARSLGGFCFNKRQSSGRSDREKDFGPEEDFGQDEYSAQEGD